MRKILITNDDGIDADGLIRLARAAIEFGEVWVVAPDRQRSAMSHSITLRHRIEAWKVDFPVPFAPKSTTRSSCRTPKDTSRRSV